MISERRLRQRLRAGPGDAIPSTLTLDSSNSPAPAAQPERVESEVVAPPAAAMQPDNIKEEVPAEVMTPAQSLAF